MKGMAAIVSVIVLGAVLMLVGVMMTMTSINEGQTTIESQKKDNRKSLTEACVEEGLIMINKNNTLPAVNIITSLGNCSVTLNSQVGTRWDFTIDSSVNVKLDRGNTLAISSWQDI